MDSQFQTAWWGSRVIVVIFHFFVYFVVLFGVIIWCYYVVLYILIASLQGAPLFSTDKRVKGEWLTSIRLFASPTLYSYQLAAL